MIHGNNIYVLTDINGTMEPIAAAKSGKLDISQEFIKARNSKDANTFRKIPTTYDWSISCDCLMTTAEYANLLLDAAINGTKITLKFVIAGTNVSGSAYVKSCKIDAANGNLAKLNATFESDGQLTDTNNGWDFINGTLYTYSDFRNGTLYTGGYLTDGTFQKDATAQ